MSRRSRNDRGRDEFEAGAAGIERELRRLAPAAAPAGLRDRVLDRAAEARRGAALAPWIRVAGVACLALIVAVLVLDPLLDRQEEARWSALLDGRRASVTSPEMTLELAEVGLGRGTAVERWERLQDQGAAVARRSLGRNSAWALERQKGWWEYEASEDLN